MAIVGVTLFCVFALAGYQLSLISKNCTATEAKIMERLHKTTGQVFLILLFHDP